MKPCTHTQARRVQDRLYDALYDESRALRMAAALHRADDLAASAGRIAELHRRFTAAGRAYTARTHQETR